MLIPSPFVLVLLGILATALAQVLLKKASYLEIKTTAWITLMGLLNRSQNPGATCLKRAFAYASRRPS